MPVELAPHQLAFWRELLAPFDESQLSFTSRGGKKLTYVDKRAITNRLDSVVGPHGWYPEYEATARGYKCRLYISVPMATPGTSVFMHKEDGAGFEEMGSTNKQTGEFEYDVDNDEKSGYTNALRRAAQDAWGIGRYLYGKGIPSFLDPKAKSLQPLVAPSAAAAALAADKARNADSDAHGRAHETMSEHGRTSAAAPPQTQTPPQRQFDNFRIPRPGKSVFAWSKEMEKTFETSVTSGMIREGEERGWGSQMATWSEQQVTEIAMGAIRFITTLPTYKGQFDQLLANTEPAKPAVAPAASGVNLADMRKGLLTKMQQLYLKQTGQPADNVGLKKVFEAIASTAANADGHTGEIPESLSKLTDVTWLTNMIKLVDQHLAAPASASAPVETIDEEDIPF
ncbi:Rad52/22 family double-strand break repair protein [Singulisphaera sp. GP187]|nr:Rad52/22 family double-strand break repair protein [Singulisphaera sp. GP187]